MTGTDGRSATGEIVALVDILLPGDGDRFPAASAVGVQWPLMERWRDSGQARGLDELVLLLAALGGPLQDLDEARRVAVVARLEKEHPAVFVALRRIVYLSYYEAQPVIDAIARLGHDYASAPQPRGYHLRRFQREVDGPHHSRGRYLSTDGVCRVDLTGMEHLAGGRGGP